MALNETQKKERSEYLERNLEITECSQRRHYAFISYASDNWETIFKSAVVPMQKQYGLRVYADKAFDKVNDKWIVPMLRNVRGADVIVAFISQSYIESYACFLELLTAVNNRKQVVFVSLEDQLRLGDTTDLPLIERGVKNEILNQGANISTNTNNTSNDTMRAMKSAYTSLSTLLQQDALSKYDISDAFINFFRDASVNRKTIDDLGALRRTIKSVSRDVFDKALIAEQFQKSVPESAPTQVAEPVRQAGPDSVQTVEPEQSVWPEHAPVQPAVLESKADFSFSDSELKTKKPLNGKRIGGIVVVAVAALVVLFVILGRTKNVTDMVDTTPDVRDGQGTHTAADDTEKSETWVDGGVNVTLTLDDGVYTGTESNGKPDGIGTMKYISGKTYEGEWKDGVRTGQGKATYSDGSVYEGEWKNNLGNGQGTKTYSNGNVYEGEWKDGNKDGQGTLTYPSGAVYEGEWKNNLANGQGTKTYSNGNVYEGEWKDGYKDGQGTLTYSNGDVYEGGWKVGKRNGKGILTYSDGSVLEGEWKDDEQNGDFVRTKADGTVVNEKWDNGTQVD